MREEAAVTPDPFCKIKERWLYLAKAGYRINVGLSFQKNVRDSCAWDAKPKVTLRKIDRGLSTDQFRPTYEVRKHGLPLSMELIFADGKHWHEEQETTLVKPVPLDLPL